jgi:hypothetical protein
MHSALSVAQRKPTRISITVPYCVADSLQQRSDVEGRSLSNLASHLLELALRKDGSVAQDPAPKRWGPSY